MNNLEKTKEKGLSSCIKNKSIRWAEFRFSVVGRLLSSPPQKGELKKEINKLTKKEWVHPITERPIRLSQSTIERWYYRSLNSKNDSPLTVLRTTERHDRGNSRALTEEAKKILVSQFCEHPSWSVQLHEKNLRAQILPPAPSYATVRRYYRSVGIQKCSKKKERYRRKEIRSFENEYVNGNWHFDFHHARRQIVNTKGENVTPILLGIFDDHSRLVCHAQWFYHENTESLVHGFIQAIQKRGIPRSVMTDNGAAFISDEFKAGLLRLGILHEKTLPYSPHQNGKMERFWGFLEGELMSMIENQRHIDLNLLNQYTTKWVEMAYNRGTHSEIRTTPIDRFLSGENVGRPSLSHESLKDMFRRDVTRKQRKTDGTVSIEGVRFEIPSIYRHFSVLTIRYARWDLRFANIVEAQAHDALCKIYPLDKKRNANKKRRTITIDVEKTEDPPLTTNFPPYMKSIIDQYDRMGSPIAPFIPLDNEKDNKNE